MSFHKLQVFPIKKLNHYRVMYDDRTIDQLEDWEVQVAIWTAESMRRKGFSNDVIAGMVNLRSSEVDKLFDLYG